MRNPLRSRLGCKATSITAPWGARLGCWAHGPASQDPKEASLPSFWLIHSCSQAPASRYCCCCCGRDALPNWAQAYGPSQSFDHLYRQLQPQAASAINSSAACGCQLPTVPASVSHQQDAAATRMHQG